MPLPMVHLAIAIGLSKSWPQASPAGFLLGSLAPDAIHTRTSSTISDKNESHLRNLDGEVNLEEVQRLFFSAQKNGEPLASFSAGYVAHLLADHLWIKTVYCDFKKKLTNLDPEELRKLYYLETDQVDFDLYRQMKWREQVWEQLAQATALDFPPLLSAEEIDQWRIHTLHWFDELMQEPKIGPQHITDALVGDFIEKAVRSVSDFFNNSAYCRPKK